MQVAKQERWEYRTKDEQWSVTVLQDSVVLQTTAYEKTRQLETPNVEVAGDGLGNVTATWESLGLGVRARGFDSATRAWAPEETLQEPVTSSSPTGLRLVVDDFGNAIVMWAMGGQARMRRFACEG